MAGTERGAIQILDQGVSRKHAELFRIGELFFIRDLDSRNGTFVNTEKVTEVVLRLGDQIQIGNTTLIFEDHLAHLRDSRAIVINDDSPPEGASSPENGNGKQEAFRPSSTLQIRLTDTITGLAKQSIPEEDTAESKRLAALLGISHLIGSEKDLSRLISLAAEQLGKAVDADNVFIFKVREGESSENTAFELLGRYDRSDDLQNEGVSRSIIRDCLEQGHAVLTSDAGLDSRFHAMASVVMKRIKSVICVPITGLGKNIGVLYISHSHISEAFNGEDLELASAAGIQLGTTIQLLQVVHHSDEVFRNSIGTLVKAIEMREPLSSGKAERVAAICLGIAKELGWHTQECRNSWLAGMLFDIGSIPLSDRDREAEFKLDVRKNHYASELLGETPGLDEILPGIVQQKERWDGSGSPEGKKGDEICSLACVLGLACEFDELLQHGGLNRTPLSHKEALLKISKLADHLFPHETVNALLLAFRRGRLFSQEEISFFEMPQ